MLLLHGRGHAAPPNTPGNGVHSHLTHACLNRQKLICKPPTNIKKCITTQHNTAEASILLQPQQHDPPGYVRHPAHQRGGSSGWGPVTTVSTMHNQQQHSSTTCLLGPAINTVLPRAAPHTLPPEPQKNPQMRPLLMLLCRSRAPASDVPAVLVIPSCLPSPVTCSRGVWHTCYALSVPASAVHTPKESCAQR